MLVWCVCLLGLGQSFLADMQVAHSCMYACAYECPACDDMCPEGFALSTCCICFLQVPAASLSDEGTWVWGWLECPTGVAAAALDGGMHDSFVLAGCEAVSVMGQPG